MDPLSSNEIVPTDATWRKGKLSPESCAIIVESQANKINDYCCFKPLNFMMVCYAATAKSRGIWELWIGIHEPDPYASSYLLFRNGFIYTSVRHVNHSLFFSYHHTFLHVIPLSGMSFSFTSLPTSSECNWQTFGTDFCKHLTLQIESIGAIWNLVRIRQCVTSIKEAFKSLPSVSSQKSEYFRKRSPWVRK